MKTPLLTITRNGWERTSIANRTPHRLLPVRSRQSRWSRLTWCLIAFLAALLPLSSPEGAEPVTSQVLASVVKIRAQVPSEARTARFLGTERAGSGVVIDKNGLVLTIGYLILEATTVEIIGPDGRAVEAVVVGNDYDTGFGLLRATESLEVSPMPLGQSTEVKARAQVLVASYSTPESVQATYVTSRREFAGYWEYLLDDAIFTSPPHPQFAGAALIGPDGRLLGIGSLFVNDAIPGEQELPGNMFVPIDQLKPILDDLIAKGRAATPSRPWLGVFTEEFRGHLFVTGVAPDGPANQAGLRPGDIILRLGEKEIDGPATFYREMWAQGHAGVEIPLTVLQGSQIRDLAVRSADRDTYFHLGPREQPLPQTDDAQSVRRDQLVVPMPVIFPHG